MAVDFPYVPKHCSAKNYSYKVQAYDSFYQHRSSSVKLKKSERKIIDL